MMRRVLVMLVAAYAGCSPSMETGIECGPEAITNHRHRTCDPIPGLAEGRAAMRRLQVIMLKQVLLEMTLHAMVAHEVEVTMRVYDLCAAEAAAKAMSECLARRLPGQPLPPGLSTGQCVHLWRNGTRDVGDVPGLRPFAGWVAKCVARSDEADEAFFRSSR